MPSWWNATGFGSTAEAVRFNRERDAMRVLQHVLPADVAAECRATEHSWKLCGDD
jgi:hypothetical protein